MKKIIKTILFIAAYLFFIVASDVVSDYLFYNWGMFIIGIVHFSFGALSVFDFDSNKAKFKKGINLAIDSLTSGGERNITIIPDKSKKRYPVRQRKTGAIYFVLSDNVICATEGFSDIKLVTYCRGNQDYSMEATEFWETFARVKNDEK